MIEQIDLRLLVEIGLTPNQFIICRLVQNRNYTILNELENFTTLSLQDDINILDEKDYVIRHNKKEGFNINNVYVTEKFLELISKGDFFDEFYETYPVKVRRPDGNVDYLKSEINRCRRLYKLHTKEDKISHKHLLRCLRYDIEDKKRTGQIVYMKKMVNWLISEEWTVIEQKMNDSTPINDIREERYGTTIE